MSDMKDRVMQVILAEANVEKGFIPDHAKNKFSDNSGNLKCPFYQQELEPCGTYLFGAKKLGCANCGLTGDSKLFLELIRTRKALDVAVGQLKKTRDYIEDFRYQETNFFLVDSKDVSIILDETNEALEQITALEQKDVK